jgi:phospholipase C
MIKTLLHALVRSDYWHKSAFIWTYDSWGGWYDHVQPPQVDDYGYGFRVPALLVSPYAKHGYVDSTELDYTSILKFIADNWSLKPLADRDAEANSIINAFDFTQPPRRGTFIPFERKVAVVKPEPRREIIYLLYGGAFLLAAAIIFAAHLQTEGSRPLVEREADVRSMKL